MEAKRGKEERNAASTIGSVPAIRRLAEAGTIEAIGEDLRRIRERGGVARADDEAFAATLEMISPGVEIVDDDLRLMAHNIVLTHVRRVCTSVAHGPSAEPCALAAAESLQTTMQKPAEDSRKVASIRRLAQAQHGCHLTVDAIRKREDALLQKVANELHADLVASLEKRGPQTVEEIARYIADEVKEVWENLDDGLRRIYRVAPVNDQQYRDELMLWMLYDVAHMQFWCGRMLGVRSGSQKLSRVDLYFADIAAVVMVTAFGYYNDRAIVNEILTSVGRQQKSAFLDQLQHHPEGPGIIRRWKEWISSCHGECAYQRTYRTKLLCEPHELTYALYIFVDLYSDLLSGELDESLKSELNA